MAPWRLFAAVALAAGLSGCALVSGPTECTGENCVNSDEFECEILEQAPDSLLDTCFAEIANGRIAPNLRTYEPQFPMFVGDTVESRRWIYLPPDSTVVAADADNWEFPTGTIFWQELADGDRIETQMLEKTGVGIGRGAWRPSVFLWTVDQTDAHQSRRAGDAYVADSLSDWAPAVVSECMDCHQSVADVALGFSALQLSNPDLAGSIDSWGSYVSSSGDTPAAVDIVGTDNDRAMLGYLHANCGTCHSPRGISGGLGLDLNYEVEKTTDLLSSNAMKTALYNDLRLVPGNPGGSALYTMVADGSMSPARRTSAVDTAFVDALRSWTYELEWPTATMVAAPADIDAGSAQGQTLFGYTTVVNDATQGEVFSRQGPYTFRSRVVIPVDPSLTYRVSGRFRSNAVTESRFYFGVAPYDSEGKFISAYRANRQGAITTVVRSATDATTITTVDPIDTWNQPETTQGYRRAIGIYYDGDTTRLPDYVHTNNVDHLNIGPEFGAYSAATGTTITLNVDLPAEVLAQMTDQTAVANHYAGATYLYTAASSEMATSDWTDFTGDLTGAVFSASRFQFRTGTRYVRFLILANYQQAGEATELLFDDLRFEVVTP